MTLPASGQISIADIDAEVNPKPSGYSASLGFLNELVVPAQRPASPNLDGFHGKAYYQRNTDGNCSNANCGNCNNCANGNCTSNCNCGNIQCNNCLIAGPANCAVCNNCTSVNCVNCDSQAWLQSDCNCACTYNCNCNAAVSYNCTTSQTTYNCNCACNCSKIICAKLYDFGLMNQNIWAADQMYGQWLRKKDRRVYRGYVRWARIVTAWMDGKGPVYMPWITDAEKRAARQKDRILDMAIKIGTPWSEHMAYLMGALPEDNIQGRILMEIGKPICRIVDRLPRRRRKQSHSLGTLYTMWSLFYFSYYTSLAGARIYSFFKGFGLGRLIQRTTK